MLYAMEQGPTEKAILEQCYRTRQPVPDKIKNAPVLQQGLEFYYIGFQNLHTSRQLGGFGEGPISWFAMEDYCDRLQVWNMDDREDFIFLVTKMDEAYRKHVAKKQETERISKRPASKRRK